MMLAWVLRNPRSPIMSRALMSLKAGAVTFTVLWTAWMMWWSGSYSSANLVILMLIGTLVGYLWYRAMRWQFERMGMLPHKSDGTAR
jgi:hypothetical protein